MAEEAKIEEKREPKKGKFLACIAIDDQEDGEDPIAKQLNRIYKTDVAAERAVYDWLKREYLGRKDERDYLIHIERDDDDQEFFLDDLIGWIGEHKKLTVAYDVVELDE